MFFIILLILFGVLQGLTEFLPVSSSGHLTLFSHFFGDFMLEGNELTLNIAVHLGTLLTVVIYYFKDIRQMVVGALTGDKAALQLTWFIIVASVPTAVIGLLMKKKGEWLLTNPFIAASCLLVTAAILWTSEKVMKSKVARDDFGMTTKKALIIGVVQGLAVLPGISRSGSTIVTAMYMGVAPANAAKFSFLISLPAILGAGLLEFLSLETAIDPQALVVSGVASFITGLFALSLMVNLTKKGRLPVFSYYLVGLSLSFFAFHFMKGI